MDDPKNPVAAAWIQAAPHIQRIIELLRQSDDARHLAAATMLCAADSAVNASVWFATNPNGGEEFTRWIDSALQMSAEAYERALHLALEQAEQDHMAAQTRVATAQNELARIAKRQQTLREQLHGDKA